jgi:hypothetical protein
MNLHFWTGTVVMVLVATVLALMVYMIFAMTPYPLPPPNSVKGALPVTTTPAHHVFQRE